MANRSYCFTWNNPSAEEQKIFIENLPIGPVLRYICFGEEKGEEKGTLHLQGYLELKEPRRIAWVQREIFQNKKIHLEGRRGTREQARDYCKKDGRFKEFGEWREGGQGRRNDLSSFYDALKAKTMLEAFEEHKTCAIKFFGNAQKLYGLFQRHKCPTFRPVRTMVLIGPTGSGKTLWAVKTHPDAYMLNQDSKTHWWDGYMGESEIIIDDFDGWIDYRFLLKLLDRYKLRLPVKGSHCWAIWKKVYITSNIHPENWFPNEDYAPLRRRLTKIVEYPNEDNVDLTDVEESEDE